jgi:K+-transporting ATPase A subunit
MDRASGLRGRARYAGAALRALLLCVRFFILGLPAVAAVLPLGTAGLGDAGPHGFSELLYAYTSASATNGSAVAGLSANTSFYAPAQTCFG